MKRIGIRSLALVVTAFALTAIGAASASAAIEPGIVSCVKLAPGEKGTHENLLCTTAQTGGPYAYVELGTRTWLGLDGTSGDGLWCAKLSAKATNSLWRVGCTEHSATGEYARYLVLTGLGKKAEITVLPSIKHYEETVGPGTIKAGGVATVTCKGGSGAGEITSMDTVGKVVVKFTGCEVGASGSTTKCSIHSTSPLGVAGEIVTRTLRGLLGTVKTSEAQTEVGVLVEPETTKKFTTLAETSCVKLETVVEGSVAGEIGPVRTLSKIGFLNFETNAGTQLIKEIHTLQGAIKPALSAFGIVEVTEENSEVRESTEAGEIT